MAPGLEGPCSIQLSYRDNGGDEGSRTPVQNFHLKLSYVDCHLPEAGVVFFEDRQVLFLTKGLLPEDTGPGRLSSLDNAHMSSASSHADTLGRTQGR